MNRRELILAAFAAGGENTSYSPVQVQKLLFLIDRKAADLVGGTHFNFVPYDYGPFDRAVYNELDALAQDGLVEVNTAGPYRKYRLTADGYTLGAEELDGLTEDGQSLLTKIARWIRSQNFQQIVATIYKHYPEMKARSVFST